MVDKRIKSNTGDDIVLKGTAVEEFKSSLRGELIRQEDEGYDEVAERRIQEEHASPGCRLLESANGRPLMHCLTLAPFSRPKGFTNLTPVLPCIRFDCGDVSLLCLKPTAEMCHFRNMAR